MRLACWALWFVRNVQVPPMLHVDLRACCPGRRTFEQIWSRLSSLWLKVRGCSTTRHVQARRLDAADNPIALSPPRLCSNDNPGAESNIKQPTIRDEELKLEVVIDGLIFC